MAKLDEHSLRVMMSSQENEQIEFKRELLGRKEIAEYSVAMGNEGGGWLIMGVTNGQPRSISGVREQTRDELQIIQSSVMDSAAIKVHVHYIRTTEGNILAVEIPSRLPGKVFHTKTGKYLMRLGESLRGMTNEEIVSFLAETPRSTVPLSAPPILSQLRELAAAGKIIHVAPIVPRSRESDKFQIEAASEKIVSLDKLSFPGRVTVPLSRIREVLWAGPSDPATIMLDGRLQWLDRSEAWRFLPDSPGTQREREMGFERLSSLNDRRVIELQQYLQSRLAFHWFHERSVGTMQGQGWSLFYDEDGRFLRIKDGRESLVLMVNHGNSTQR